MQNQSSASTGHIWGKIAKDEGDGPIPEYHIRPTAAILYITPAEKFISYGKSAAFTASYSSTWKVAGAAVPGGATTSITIGKDGDIDPDPGEHTITATREGTSVTATATVVIVRVEKIQYDDNGTWTDMPNPLYVYKTR